MLNINVHKNILINILREIYSDAVLRNTLGFKGGTAAMLFYKLPRFSVDLDFDLLNLQKKDEVFARLPEILSKYGILYNASDKKNTLFFLLSYKKGERLVKVEISKRKFSSNYTPLNFLGISMLVMGREDMLASKLSALLTRKKLAMRDFFDLWFFLHNNWQINEVALEEKSGLALKDALSLAENKVKRVKKTELLSGLGDLLDSKQKDWVRDKLKDDLLFLLKLYASNLRNVKK
ncbi:hypothetical protein A2803_00910 [Candidatus Woesebacteria bacterium RIFCSPHIGHO2_01_FULL_44_21]|uniref:Nucleotidyl transferase AbiEii/AbiGii toxin family protein n=1 Tax=Candidatus Woesebacteria bacterium RIFCSPHIGHO2_01_FULL_44_21 TaxID=1802503 RepID=A0A1F7YYM6_9BACT|nr:MAG: hypothetical protein A2803_00910 [Candidatus Woesebacteria bacterium RIFCSPHIGHO2_01_FULL_44_21]